MKGKGTMEGLVIFSSPVMCVILGVILLLHLASAILPLLCRGGSFEASDAARAAVWIMSILNCVLHFVIIVYALLNEAAAKELFLAVMLSATVATVAIGIKERYGK